jgi:predicted DsbA family dithiol-disulfide isomerase
VKIEVWSDVVCPWCYIGLKRLQKALAVRPDLSVEVQFQPFELNPDMPDSGMDRREYLQIKFGDPDRFQGMQGRMQAIAGELGIEYHPGRQTRMPSTRRAHMLLAASAGLGVQMPLKEALLRAYFAEGRDIGAPQVLEELAAPLGIDASQVQKILSDAELRSAVGRHAEEARRMGVNGVPTFVFDRRLGFSGAQEVPVFTQALEQAAAMAGAAC